MMMPVAVNGRLLMNTPYQVQLSMSKLENLEEKNQNLIPKEVNTIINIFTLSDFL